MGEPVFNIHKNNSGEFRIEYRDDADEIHGYVHFYDSAEEMQQEKIRLKDGHTFSEIEGYNIMILTTMTFPAEGRGVKEYHNFYMQTLKGMGSVFLNNEIAPNLNKYAGYKIK